MNLDFKKMDGLVTAVIQDHASGRVLMAFDVSLHLSKNAGECHAFPV